MKGKNMDNMQEQGTVTSDSIAAEGVAKTREAYSTPHLAEFGTIQKITATAGGSHVC
jgi:hypothetical protein